MPETSSSEGGQRRQGRNRNRGRSRGDYRPESSSNRGGRPERNRQPKQTGFQKFLSIISFGLLGKPAERPARPVNPARPDSARSAGGPSRDDGPYVSQGPRNRPAGGGEPRQPRAPREPRPAPTPTEVTSERLYVGNLSYDATESDLFELFRGVGGVRNAEVVVNSRTQRSKGFAFITMNSTEEAKRAVAELNAKDFMGRPLQISGAKPPSQDRGDRRGNDEGDNGQDEEASA